MMQEYKKLVEALRYCKVDYCSSCVGCPMYADYEGSECINEMHDDAADAIEELQKTLKDVQKNSGINFRMWKEAVTEAKSGNTNSCSIKNPEIKIGDTIRCLNCNKKIILDSNTFVFDFSGEYIVCPSCGATYDVLQYHIYGEKCDRKEE